MDQSVVDSVRLLLFLAVLIISLKKSNFSDTLDFFLV